MLCVPCRGTTPPLLLQTHKLLSDHVVHHTSHMRRPCVKRRIARTGGRFLACALLLKTRAFVSSLQLLNYHHSTEEAAAAAAAAAALSSRETRSPISQCRRPKLVRKRAAVWMAGAGAGDVGRSTDAKYPRPEVPKWTHKAVIIPGFATDARAFETFCHRLERRGIASVVVPIRWYHWLPTLGGRSVRPILDRIHETVIRCVGAKEHEDMPYAFNEPGLQNEVAPYTAQDFLAEMADPMLGAHHMGPLDLPLLPPKPKEEERVILVAHSAGGWMSRIYLSEASYDGRKYKGSCLVKGLVTLGTPHVRVRDEHGRDRELPFSKNFKFVEEFCTGEEGGNWEKRIPTACVGGAALQGRSSFGGLFKDLVYQSYELCCGDGAGTGDGITPLKSAFDMAGAKCYIELEGVLHAAGLGGPWYGSDDVIDSWLEPSLDAFFGPERADGLEGARSAFSAGLEPPPETVPGAAHDGDGPGKDAA